MDKRTPKTNLILFGLLLVLSACGPAPEDIDVAPREVPQTIEEVKAVRSVFNAIQPVSIERDREYCGYIIRDDYGLIDATEARSGRSDRCTPRWPRGDVEVLASYHTHAAYNPEYDSEVPSYEDMASDILEGVDGYVATPAGRIWYIDATRKEARLVCGPRCVVADPNYNPPRITRMRERYSLQDLSSRNGL